MTHYTCDCCGEPTHEPTKGAYAEVTIDNWNRGDRTRRLVVRAKITGKFDECEADAPDLCNDCRAHILREAASMLDTDREPELPLAKEAV